MTQFVKSILILVLILTNPTSFAGSVESAGNNRYIDYYEDEGRLLFKLRVHGIRAHYTQKSVLTSPLTTSVSIDSLVKNGYGGDGATTIFFSSNIAAELSLGLSVIKFCSPLLNNMANNYDGINTTAKKSSDLYMIPLTVTGQYHLELAQAIRFYVGGGYHGAYIFSRVNKYKVNNGHGAVMQAGVDFLIKNNKLINLDVRQYFLNTKVHYQKPAISNNRLSTKVKLNRLIFSIGIGFVL